VTGQRVRARARSRPAGSVVRLLPRPSVISVAKNAATDAGTEPSAVSTGGVSGANKTGRRIVTISPPSLSQSHPGTLRLPTGETGVDSPTDTKKFTTSTDGPPFRMCTRRTIGRAWEGLEIRIRTTRSGYGCTRRRLRI